MISDSTATSAYVWVWLPDATDPVPCGIVERSGPERYRFAYGRRYRERGDAISLFPDELPLTAGALETATGDLPGCLRDAAPDAWGRRVIVQRRARSDSLAVGELDELTFLLASGSNRVGALDFQASASEYVPRESPGADLETLHAAAGRVERGDPLPPELEEALRHGTSIGGARPKALLVDADRQWVAKFSTGVDLYNVVKAEFIAMRLAARVGLTVAPVRLVRSLGRDVLLVERFDRLRGDGGWRRRLMVSALTLLGLREMEARYAGYPDLAHRIRRDFAAPRETLHELFGRLVFNVLCGNTDDHARNHAAFWDGHRFELTPAYDLCPQLRTGGEATQAMAITERERTSQLVTCLEAAPLFQLDETAARAVIDRQLALIHDDWERVCDEAALPPAERDTLWGRAFLNPFALRGYDARS
ncbi:MAG: type II toxin-antitoxin system HipA family toxin [Thiohalospira sp.]